MLYPLKFRPRPKERIWGGRRLSEKLGKRLPRERTIGESWEISGLDGDVSVVGNGILAGNNLEELIEVYMGDLVGDKIYEKFGLQFPLLIKYIDAQDKLSVQVHPDDAYAQRVEGEPGKTEAFVAAGDEIVAVNGRHCFVANDMLYELMRTESYRAHFTVRRDGRLVELPDVRFDTWQDDSGETHMSLGFTVYGIRKTPANVVKEAWNSVLYYGRIIFTSLMDLLRGRESINDLSGPVGIVTAIGQAASYGWQDLLQLLVLITVNLGIFNLLPFPALDGGKVVFLLIEGVTGHAVPEKIQSGLTLAAFALLFGLMLFATYNDILRLITGAV